MGKEGGKRPQLSQNKINNMDTLLAGGNTWYTIPKAIIVYNISKVTIYNYIKEGRMEKRKIGSATFVRMK
jgi:hypothetical protein